MTNRFDEVAQLKALLGRREAIIKREQDPRSPNYCILGRIEIERDLLEAAPLLLEVAGCFQPGYAARLSKLYMLIDTYHPDNDEDLEMIEYLLKAAKIMEERDSVLAGARRQLVEEHPEVD